MEEKLRWKLLQDLASDLARLEKNCTHAELACIEVQFKRSKKTILATGLSQAVDYLVNDVYIFEDADLRQAKQIEVTTI